MQGHLNSGSQNKHFRTTGASGAYRLFLVCDQDFRRQLKVITACYFSTLLYKAPVCDVNTFNANVLVH